MLILAHEVNLCFTTLIQMLDHPKNDIFIHMNAKNTSYNPEETLKLVKHSRLFQVPRIKVAWGAYSQLEAVLSLFETAAAQEHYEHYHIMSGADLPIKKQDELIDFFERHHGVEFISIDKDCAKYEYRMKYYYLFQELKGRSGNLILRILNKMCIILQKIMHVHRNKDTICQKGSDWFSISDELVRYMLSKKDWIHKVFHHTILPTEQCIHILATNSHFRDNLYCKELMNNSEKADMRLIDWARGYDAHPHVFRMSDLEMIQNSEAMFARKFMPSVDAEIIQKIRELYS